MHFPGIRRPLAGRSFAMSVVGLCLVGVSAACGGASPARSSFPMRSSARSPASTGREVTPQGSRVVAAPPTGPGQIESDWPVGMASADLQGLARDLMARTRAQLATDRQRETLCGNPTDRALRGRRSQATQDLTAPLYPLLQRSLSDAATADPAVSVLLAATQRLVAGAHPVVNESAGGLMWVVADAYARMVCQPHPDLPAVATSAIAMVTERDYLLASLDVLFAHPVAETADPNRYWTARNDLTTFVGETFAKLSAGGADGDVAADAVVAQVTVTGAPFTCDAGAAHTFDRGGSGDSNGVVESGEILGMTLHCRNTSGQRMISQSLLVGERVPAGIVVARDEVVIAEVDAGGDFDLELGPIFLAHSAGDRPSPLELRVQTSPSRDTGAIQLTFQPLQVDVGGVEFSAFDEDRAGSSEPDSSLAMGPDDHFETQVRVTVPVGFAPTVGAVSLAFPADASLFQWEPLASPVCVPDANPEPGHFITADDLDGHVATLEVCRTLDTTSPVALARVAGKRFANVDVAVTIDSPITLAQVGTGLASVGVFSAAMSLGQRQGIPTQRAWTALRVAADLLRPAAATVSALDTPSTAWPPPPPPPAAEVAERVTAALHVLVSARLMTAAEASSLRCPFTALATAAVLNAQMETCVAFAQLNPEQAAVQESFVRHLVGWAQVVEALGDSARALLFGVDLRAAEPKDLFTNPTVLRNALIKALGAPLVGSAGGAATAPVRRWRRGAAQSAGSVGGASDSALFEVVTNGVKSPFADLPRWSFRRYAAIPLEGAQ